MSLLFSSARRIASLSVSVNVSSLDTPSLVKSGSGGTGRGVDGGKIGSCGGSCPALVVGCWVVSDGGFTGSTCEGVGTGDADGAGVPDCGVTLVPGGACGAGRSEPGGAVGFCVVGLACSGTGWLRSCPGGRVASCCVGFTGEGEGVGVCARAAEAKHKRGKNSITLKLL